MDPDEEENPNDFKGANPLEAYSNEDIAGGAVEEETDDFEPDSQLVFQRNGRGSVRQQSFNGGRGRVGSVLASRVLEESEDVIQEEGEDGQFTGDYKGQPPMRTRTRGIAMTKRASTVSINDQEQLILNQVMAKFSGQDKKGASSETEAEDQSNLKASKDAKRTSVKQVKTLSLVFQRKGVYTYMSLLFGSFLLITLIYEMVSLNTYEQPPITTKYLASLLVLHVTSFHLFILGFIYANESGDLSQFSLACLSGLLNIVAFILRAHYQFQNDDYIGSRAYFVA